MVATPKKITRNAEPFDSLGETWWLSRESPGLRKLYASIIRARARQQLIDDKPHLSEEDYEGQWERFQARIDAGAYEWGPPVEMGGTGAGKAIRAALNSDEGTILLVQMFLVEKHGEMGVSRVIDIINGNPDGMQAALRAARGLPPLPVAPASAEPGQMEAATTAEASMKPSPTEKVETPVAVAS